MISDRDDEGIFLGTGECEGVPEFSPVGLIGRISNDGLSRNAEDVNLAGQFPAEFWIPEVGADEDADFPAVEIEDGNFFAGGYTIVDFAVE